jgi:hypothetical protein
MKTWMTALAVCLGLPALAQDAPCGPRDAIIAELTDRWDETRVSVALAGQTALVETWVNLATGTWTITITDPAGRLCVALAGQAYQPMTDVLGIPG